MTSSFARAFALALLALPVAALGSTLAPPPNDNFANRITLTGTSVITSGTNVDATKQAGEPNHAGNAGGKSVWWTWTAPSSGTATIDTIGSSFDTLLAVYTGTAVNALSLVAGNDDAVGLQSEVTFSAVGGTSYQIAVDGFGGASGAITLTLTHFAPVIVYSTDFNSGSAGWTFDGPVNGTRWAVDATPAGFPSGVSRTGSSLNFNNGTDYAGNTRGGALSPSLDISAITNPVLEFYCNYDTETRGAAFDRRSLQLWSADLGALHADWQMASVGYSFNAAGGLVGIGPGPCGEAYTDLETGAPVAAWHKHRIFLDPAWGSIRVRFVFDSVDDQRNGYAGWAIDDFSVKNHPAPAPTGWPDNSPDDALEGAPGSELDTCQRAGGNLLRWSWGCTNTGSAGVHMIIGDHARSILDRSFMFYDPVHDHIHMSQYSDFSLWRQQAFGFQKVRRGPKRSFCLTDINVVIAGSPSVSPGCDGIYQAISYGWQDVYALGTSGQELSVAGLTAGVEYYLVGVIDPLNRLRETDELNQTDQIRFTLPSGPGAITPTDHSNPYAPTATALTIASATLGTFQAVPAVQLIGTGFDTTLVPVMYGPSGQVAEAPFYTIVSGTEIWVNVPGTITTPGAIDLLRPSGHAASARIGGPAPIPTPAPGAPTLGTLTVTPATGLDSAGNVGGPFLPPSGVFTVSNSSPVVLDWTASKTEVWTSLSSAGGTLLPGDSTGVTVSIGAPAAGLAVGVYADAVLFANVTNGSGSTLRGVFLSVNGPIPQMTVAPTAGLASAGRTGGPFAPSARDYLVTNTGSTSINWTATKTQPWVTLSSAGGTLAGGAGATVTVSINAGANALAAGSYADTVTFTNTTSGDGTTIRSVSLRVSTSAPPTLTINAPPSTATSSPIVVTGTAGGGNLSSVTWTNALTGESGTASGTGTWSATIPLVTGTNTIVITVVDEFGNSASATFTVDATIAAVGGGGGGGGGCGATGLEVLFVLALAVLLGRRP